MLQRAMVVAANEKTAVVRFRRSSACGHCHACFDEGAQEGEIELDNALHARCGDTVELAIHARSVLTASAIAYGVPLLALLAGALLGSLWGDIGTAVCGLLFTAGAFALLRASNKRLARAAKLGPRMVRVLPPQFIAPPAIKD